MTYFLSVLLEEKKDWVLGMVKQSKILAQKKELQNYVTP